MQHEDGKSYEIASPEGKHNPEVKSRALTDQKILDLLDLPVDDRPFVQFRLRDEAPMASLVGALKKAQSSDHIMILANVVSMRSRNARSAAGVLIALLRHPDEGVRYVVADALGRLRVGLGGVAMLHSLSNEESPRVRAMLLAGIGASGIQEGFDDLARGLADDNWVVRRMAAWGLGQLGDTHGLPILAHAAATESDCSVLEIILTAQRVLGNTNSVDSRGTQGM